MMKGMAALLILAAWCAGIGIARAQEEEQDLENQEIDVVKAYSPILADAVKIKFLASLPKLEKEKAKLSYEAPHRLLHIDYPAPEMRPLALPRESIAESKYDSYIKAGFGTQWTPLFDLYYNGGTSKRRQAKFEKAHYGLRLQHISSRGSSIEHQDYSDTKGAVFGNVFVKKAKLSGEISYDRQSVFYYGYNHSDTTLAKDDIRQRFSRPGVQCELENSQPNRKDVNYYMTGRFHHFTDINEIKEYAVKYSGRLTKTFKNQHYLTIKLEEDFSQLLRDRAWKRNIFTLNPQYTFDNDNWYLSAGLSGTWEDEVFHLFPDFATGKNLLENKIIFYNGWRRWLKKNSYASLAAENPYISPRVEIRNSRIEDRYIGFKGTPISMLTYNIQFAQKIYTNLPLFVNDTNDWKQFVVVYDDRTNIINLFAELDFSISKDLKVLLAADYFRYEPDEEEKAWHMPSLKLNLTAQYTIEDKVLFTLELFAMDRTFAKGSNEEAIKLPGTVDANLGVAYRFNDYLSLFCNLNNLAGIKHERWLNYPTYGFNGLAGAKLSF